MNIIPFKNLGIRKERKGRIFFEENNIPVERIIQEVRLQVLLGRRNIVLPFDASMAEKTRAYTDFVRALRQIFLQDMRWQAYKVKNIEGLENIPTGRLFYIGIVDRACDMAYTPKFESHRGRQVEQFLGSNRNHYYNDLSGYGDLLECTRLPESRPKQIMKPRYSVLMDKKGAIEISLCLVRDGNIGDVWDRHIVCGPIGDDSPAVELKISQTLTEESAQFDVSIEPRPKRHKR